MTYASGVGSMPGGGVGEEQDNARAYAEATRIVLGEVDPVSYTHLTLPTTSRV